MQLYFVSFVSFHTMLSRYLVSACCLSPTSQLKRFSILFSNYITKSLAGYNNYYNLLTFLPRLNSIQIVNVMPVHAAAKGKCIHNGGFDSKTSTFIPNIVYPFRQIWAKEKPIMSVFLTAMNVSGRNMNYEHINHQN